MLAFAQVNRVNLVVDSFFPDILSADKIPLATIVDLPTLNNMLAREQLPTRVSDSVLPMRGHFLPSCARYENFINSPTGLMHFADMLSTRRASLPLPARHYWGPAWCLATVVPHNDTVQQLQNQWMANMPFTALITTRVATVQKLLGLTPLSYAVVHLRLEDDFIATFRINKTEARRHFDAYCRLLQENIHSPSEPIYVASGLDLASPFMREFLEKFPQVVTKSLVPDVQFLPPRDSNSQQGPGSPESQLGPARSEGQSAPTGSRPYSGEREFHAAVDYVLATQARLFVGNCVRSSFARAVVNAIAFRQASVVPPEVATQKSVSL